MLTLGDFESIWQGPVCLYLDNSMIAARWPRESRGARGIGSYTNHRWYLGIISLSSGSYFYKVGVTQAEISFCDRKTAEEAEPKFRTQIATSRVRANQALTMHSIFGNNKMSTLLKKIRKEKEG
jgi:hypothetical protein